MTTICDGCSHIEPQLSDFVDNGHITYLCTPCWQEADAFRILPPSRLREKAA